MHNYTLNSIRLTTFQLPNITYTCTAFMAHTQYTRTVQAGSHHKNDAFILSFSEDVRSDVCRRYYVEKNAQNITRKQLINTFLGRQYPENEMV